MSKKKRRKGKNPSAKSAYHPSWGFGGGTSGRVSTVTETHNVLVPTTSVQNVFSPYNTNDVTLGDILSGNNSNLYFEVFKRYGSTLPPDNTGPDTQLPPDLPTGGGGSGTSSGTTNLPSIGTEGNMNNENLEQKPSSGNTVTPPWPQPSGGTIHRPSQPRPNVSKEETVDKQGLIRTAQEDVKRAIYNLLTTPPETIERWVTTAWESTADLLDDPARLIKGVLDSMINWTGYGVTRDEVLNDPNMINELEEGDRIVKKKMDEYSASQR